MLEKTLPIVMITNLIFSVCYAKFVLDFIKIKSRCVYPAFILVVVSSPSLLITPFFAAVTYANRDTILIATDFAYPAELQGGVSRPLQGSEEIVVGSAENLGNSEGGDINEI